MRFVHSFWSKPLINNKFDNYQTLLPVILSDYAYSASCIKTHGDSIRLFTDAKGAELLSFIPYDEIIVLDRLDDASTHFAAQIKFEALYRMDLDEILIDGDLFIRKPEAFDRIENMKQDFVYSFYEPNSFILSSEEQIEKCTHIFSILMQHYDSFNNGIYNLDDSIYEYSWPNTSLMKFNNRDLKNEYILQYDFFRDLLKNDNFDNTWPDIIIEQRHMDKLLNYKYFHDYSSAPIIEGFPSEEANEEAIRIGFTHLGSGKIQHSSTIFGWLHNSDPVLYEKTLEQIGKYILIEKS